MADKPKPPPATPLSFQAAQEREAAAHNAFKLLWMKVKTHADGAANVEKRESSLQRVRSCSATRAKRVREELAAAKELADKDREKDMTHKSQLRARVLKTEEAQKLEQDMRLKPQKPRKVKRPTDEELAANATAWVKDGRGGYNFCDLEDARLQRAMVQAELALKRANDKRLLQLKQRNVAEVRAMEARIMHEKSGATARYHLPVRKSELHEKDMSLLSAEKEELGDPENPASKGRKMAPSVTGIMIPDLYKSEGKRQRREAREAQEVLNKKRDVAEKHAREDIDAAAKLLILHAHMLRRACVEANAALKKEGEEAEAAAEE